MLLENQEIDIFIASKIGSFKHIKYHTDSSKNNKKCIENLINIKTLQKDDTITCMAWGNPEQTDILIGRKNQQVQTYNTQQGLFTKTVTADYGSGEVVGVGRYKRRLITALSSGVVKIWSKKEEILVNTGGELDRLKSCDDDRTLFATGGQENDLKVWRIGEPEPVFHAKNLANDWLQLRQPVWVSDLCFLPGEDGKLLAACSRYGYVRLYDTRAQRRPVCNVEFKAMAATCITPSFDDRQVLVGFGRGQLHQVDLRAKGRPDKGFKGACGAVTSIDLVRDTRLVVSCSLDRHVRVHDFNTKALLYKQYLTSKLSSLLVQTATTTPLKRPDLEPEVKDEDEVEVKEEDDLDLLFENMDTVGEKPKKKKNITTDPQPAKAKKIKPSTEGSTEVDIDGSNDAEQTEDAEETEDAIKKLLKSTEKKKKRMDRKKKEKRAKSLFHNA